MKKWLSLGLALAVLAGCSPEKFVKKDNPGGFSTVLEKGTPIPHVLTIGDVEGQVSLAATIPESSRGPAVTVEEMNTRNELLTFCTVTIDVPRPLFLPGQFTIRAKKQFRDRPVAARARIYREIDGGEPEQIGEFATVIGSNAMRRGPESYLEEPVMQFEADILQDLPAGVESMLVLAKMEVLLMPEGTDENTLDPVTATVEDPTDQTVIESNPMRVNFAAPSL